MSVVDDSCACNLDARETLSLGGFDLLSVAPVRLDNEPDGSPYVPFLSAAHSAKRAVHHRASLVIASDARPAVFPDRPPVFETEAWQLFRHDGTRTVQWRSVGGPLYRTMTLSDDFGTSVTSVSPAWLKTSGADASCRAPLRYPADQFIMMYLLAGQGLILHAAGTVVGEDGLVLAGCSGAGKTTLTRNVMDDDRFEMLSDDRVIIRSAPKGFDVYGTPWAGEAQVSANRGAPLRAVGFIQHAAQGRVVKLEARDALARLFSVASVPFFEGELLDAYLDIMDRLVSSVAFYDLYVPPDDGARDAVLRLLRE